MLCKHLTFYSSFLLVYICDYDMNIIEYNVEPIYVCMYVCMYVFMYLCMYICMYFFNIIY